MKSTLRWNVKEKQKKHYRSAFGTTDYDIPMFNFKAAVFIFVAILLIMSLIPQLTSHLVKDPRILNMLICSPCSGLSVGYAQYFMTKKTGFEKGFVVVSIVFTILTMLVLFLVYYVGKLA